MTLAEFAKELELHFPGAHFTHAAYKSAPIVGLTDPKEIVKFLRENDGPNAGEYRIWLQVNYAGDEFADWATVDLTSHFEDLLTALHNSRKPTP